MEAEQQQDRSSAPPDEPRLPLGQLLVLGFAAGPSCMALTIIFPYVAFQVQSFGVEEEQVGYYVGILGSAFMWTRTASQIPAGILSDRFGYKPVLVTSLLLLSVGTLAYGLATSFWMAVLARALTGLFHMVLPPAKALAGDICSTSPTNSKTGMSILVATIQLGATIGPALGGLTSDPCPKYGLCGDDSVFGQYPYLPPSLILSVVLLLSAAVIGIWLLEPLKSRQLPGGQHQEAVEGFELVNTTQSEDASDASETTRLESKLEGQVGMPPEAELEALHSEQQGERELELRKPQSGTVFVSPRGAPGAGPKGVEAGTLGLVDVMRNSCAVLSIVSYSWCSMINMLLSEVWALWCVTSTSFGGLGWDSATVGGAIATASLIVFFMQLMLYPRIAGTMGILQAFKLGTLAAIPVVLLMPWVGTLQGQQSSTVVWVLMVAVKVILDFLQCFTFNSVFVLINNSVPKALLGTTNGLAMTVASIGKGMGPGCGGAIFAWSISNQQGYPLNYHLSFILAALLFVAQYLIALRLPRSLEDPFP